MRLCPLALLAPLAVASTAASPKKEEQYEILSSAAILTRLQALAADYPAFATLTTTQEWFGLPRAGEWRRAGVDVVILTSRPLRMTPPGRPRMAEGSIPYQLALLARRTRAHPRRTRARPRARPQRTRPQPRARPRWTTPRPRARPRRTRPWPRARPRRTRPWPRARPRRMFHGRSFQRRRRDRLLAAVFLSDPVASRRFPPWGGRAGEPTENPLDGLEDGWRGTARAALAGLGRRCASARLRRGHLSPIHLYGATPLSCSLWPTFPRRNAALLSSAIFASDRRDSACP